VDFVRRLTFGLALLTLSTLSHADLGGCASYSTAQANCGAKVAQLNAQYPAYAPFTCSNIESPPIGSQVGVLSVLSNSNGVQGFYYGYNCAGYVDNPCEEGADQFEGSFGGVGIVGCDGGCKYECGSNLGGLGGCASLDYSGDMRTYGSWAQTGEVCGVPDEPPEPPGGCMEMGSTGFQFCEDDPPGCVRSPGGSMLCPNVPGPDCATDSTGAACSNSPPPEGFGPPQGPYTLCTAGVCVPVVVAPPEEAEECEEGDPNCDDPPDDCPADDPNCEDDNQCPEGTTGTPPDCEPEDEPGICTQDNQTVCDILREIRTATRATEAQTKLEVAESRETNAKLKALKDAVVTGTKDTVAAVNRVKNSVDGVKSATNAAAATIGAKVAANTAATSAVKTSVDAVKSSVDAAKNAVDAVKTDTALIATRTNTTATNVAATTTAVNAVKTDTALIATRTNTTATNVAATTAAVTTGNGKLDGILTAIQNSSLCGGLGEPACSTSPVDNSDVVAAVNTQGGDIVDAIDGIFDGDAVDPGQGATQADTDAAGVQSLSIGVDDLDQSGFALGGTCPAFPALTIGGVSWEIDHTFFCQFLDMVNVVLMLAGAVISARILMGN
jgi:hypothetical protein